MAYHPPPQRDLTRVVFDCNGGIKQQSHTSRRLESAVETGTIQTADTAVENVQRQRHRFNKQTRKFSWLEHHSLCQVNRGKYKWEHCLG